MADHHHHRHHHHHHRHDPSHLGPGTLYARLSRLLPDGLEVGAYHVSTPPTKGDPLFAAAPGEKQQRTYCESQFLTVSITPPGHPHTDAVLVYAIEVLIYSTATLTTLFVAKADSTGYLSLLPRSRPGHAPPIRTITAAFIAWLAEHRQRPGIPLVVSLFARAQDQYLFPGSIENTGKHVLDDRQLVKWWCKTLDPVLRNTSTSSTPDEDGKDDDDDDEPARHAYVIVPGFDKYETTSFFPSSWRADPPEAPRWHHGHPLREIAPNPAAPPRCLVPHFPDDPKARYLDDLDHEIPDQSASQTLFSPSKKGRGMWKSIKTLEQFWDTMAFRQECSSGRMVGFLWLVFAPSADDANTHHQFPDSQASLSSIPATSQDTPSISNMLSDTTTTTTTTTTSTKRPRPKRLTGPIVPRLPRIKSASSSFSTTSQPELTPYYKWPNAGRGQVVLDHSSYLRVHDLLLRLDFSTLGNAIEGTRKWASEVKVMGGTSDGWGTRVAGTLKEPEASATAPGISSDKVQANDLSGMLVRKRKPDKVDSAVSAPVVNVLSSSIVRKKPRILPSQVNE